MRFISSRSLHAATHPHVPSRTEIALEHDNTAGAVLIVVFIIIRPFSMAQPLPIQACVVRVHRSSIQTHRCMPVGIRAIHDAGLRVRVILLCSFSQYRRTPLSVCPTMCALRGHLVKFIVHPSQLSYIASLYHPDLCLPTEIMDCNLGTICDKVRSYQPHSLPPSLFPCTRQTLDYNFLMQAIPAYFSCCIQYVINPLFP